MSVYNIRYIILFLKKTRLNRRYFRPWLRLRLFYAENNNKSRCLICFQFFSIFFILKMVESGVMGRRSVLHIRIFMDHSSLAEKITNTFVQQANDWWQHIGRKLMPVGTVLTLVQWCNSHWRHHVRLELEWGYLLTLYSCDDCQRRVPNFLLAVCGV